MDDKKKEVIKAISRHFEIPLSPDDVNLLSEQSQIKKFKHKTIVVAKGEICNDYFYIHRGLVRQYFVSDNKELTISIAHEGQVVCCMSSFYNHQPSEIVIETIEPSTLYCLSSSSIAQFRSTSINMSRFCFAFITRVMQSMESSNFIIRIPKAAERYQKLMDKSPELVRRTPIKYLASLLQIRPETLSRIRKVCPDDAVWSAYFEREGKPVENRG